jgi:hypothetical protein
MMNLSAEEQKMLRALAAPDSPEDNGKDNGDDHAAQDEHNMWSNRDLLKQNNASIFKFPAVGKNMLSAVEIADTEAISEEMRNLGLDQESRRVWDVTTAAPPPVYTRGVTTCGEMTSIMHLPGGDGTLPVCPCPDGDSTPLKWKQTKSETSVNYGCVRAYCQGASKHGCHNACRTKAADNPGIKTFRQKYTDVWRDQHMLGGDKYLAHSLFVTCELGMKLCPDDAVAQWKLYSKCITKNSSLFKSLLQREMRREKKRQEEQRQEESDLAAAKLMQAQEEAALLRFTRTPSGRQGTKRAASNSLPRPNRMPARRQEDGGEGSSHGGNPWTLAKPKTPTREKGGKGAKGAKGAARGAGKGAGRKQWYRK